MSLFNVLYTHQKIKKAKVWQDGQLSVVDSSKRVLYDSKRTKLDTIFSTKQVTAGDEYETDKYLVVVDCLVELSPSALPESTSQQRTSQQQPRPAFSNRLAASKHRKGFNPPKRVAAAVSVPQDEPSQKQQVSENSRPLSLFSTYTQVPAYQGVDNSLQVPVYKGVDNSLQVPAYKGVDNSLQVPVYKGENNSLQVPTYKGGDNSSQVPAYTRGDNSSAEVSFTAEVTDFRSVKDILTLITADRTVVGVPSLNKQRSAGVTTDFLDVSTTGGPLHDSLTHNKKPRIEANDRANECNASASGGSLWGDFLSQEQATQAKIIAGISETDSLDEKTTPQSAVDLYTSIHYPHQPLTSETAAKDSTMSTTCKSMEKELAQPSVESTSSGCQPLTGHSTLLNQRVSVADVHPSCSNLQLEDTNNSAGRRPKAPAELGCVTARSNDNETALKDPSNTESLHAPICKESPQVATFSLGSLPAVTDDEMSQSSTELQDCQTSIPRASLQVKRSTLPHAKTYMPSRHAVEDLTAKYLDGSDQHPLGADLTRGISGMSHNTFCGDNSLDRSVDSSMSSLLRSPPTKPAEIIYTQTSSANSSVSVPPCHKHILDIIRSDYTDDLDGNTSLFDLDDSLRPTQRMQPQPNPMAGVSNVYGAESNVWSMFASPKKNKAHSLTKSIFDETSPDVLDSSSLTSSLGLSTAERPTRHCTELLPPDASVFGSTLPSVKVQQAKSKVQEDLYEPCKARPVFVTAASKGSSCSTSEEHKLMVDSWTLRFPPYAADLPKPTRNMVLPISYKNTVDYRQNLEQLLREYINIVLLDICKRYHEAINAVDITGAGLGSTDLEGERTQQKMASGNPKCKHGVCSKMIEVKKEGPNRGRMFYACSNSRSEQCKFFEWADELKQPTASESAVVSDRQLKLSSAQAIEAYLKGKTIPFYCNSKLNKTSDSFTAKRWSAVNETAKNQSLYLRLSRREKASAYTKGDVWVVSQTLKFDLKGNTFIAQSAFYGPNSDLELELLPLAGYSGCNWPAGTLCHAIHIPNLSTELVCLANLQELNARTVPVLPWLIHLSGPERTVGRFEVPVSHSLRSSLVLPEDFVMRLAANMVNKYRLNDGQIESLMAVASMFHSVSVTPICLIKGVFGAGKSFLLSVIVQFIVAVLDVIDSNDSTAADGCAQSKVLISSMTNVAVDRILLGLLDQDFTDFLRVGSMKKIAKPILPHSLHALKNGNAELRELQDMLKDEELSTSEKMNIRKGITAQKSGLNKQRLGKTRVVGVTCAACSFPVLDNLTFRVVLLDECSQMTEPLSLLPIKRAACSKLVLVGDPRQLRPTIQGSDSSHDRGLEQTMFDRLGIMGVPTCQLVTQYRCHPAISAICRDLFYEGVLADGVTASQRPPLCEGLPSACLYDVQGVQRFTDSTSILNEQEAAFVCDMLSWLLVNGMEAAQIGVITLYKAQVCRIYSLMCQQPGLRKVQVATVDSFQGGERDIIILSCVRTDQMGFADDIRRTNVALSRGKHHLLMVGHRHNLRRNILWSKIVSYLEDRPDGVINGRAQARKWQLAKELSARHEKQSKRKSAADDVVVPHKAARLEVLENSALSNSTDCISLDGVTECGKLLANQSEETILLDSSCESLVGAVHEEDDFLTRYQQI